MEISLSRDFDNFIKEQMATGLYKSVNDIIQEALSLLISRKSILQSRIDMLNKDIEEALSDLEQGNHKDGHEVMRNLIAKYE